MIHDQSSRSQVISRSSDKKKEAQAPSRSRTQNQHKSNENDVGSGYNPSIVNVLQNLTKFVPSLVVQKLLAETRQPAHMKATLPELQSMETVVIFADISGFTNLSENCAKSGRLGNEKLAFCINRYMEDMVSCLNQYGGDIIKFVGDAMIVMWPPIEPIGEGSSQDDYDKERLDIVRKALQCTQEIQKQLNNAVIMPGVTLSVKIGVAYGECSILYVGGIFARNETLTVGKALVNALRSEGNATAGGQVIVHQSCFQHINADLYRACEEIYDEVERDCFYKLDLKFRGQRVKIKADVMKIRSQFSVCDLQSAQKDLEMNVTRCAIPFIKINQQEYASEIRSLTVMFVNLGVELSSAETAEGIKKIQSIMVAVQQQVYRQEGTINKLVMDDKGSTLICIWGLPPLAHQDDASRAIFAGFNMIKALNKIKNTYCNIGIASGECFSGIVGGSGSRKEFSVLGDIVNLSARIMGSIKGTGGKNKIKCDLNTRMLAARDFTFTYGDHHELKGKSISTPFFIPADPERHKSMHRDKVIEPEFFLWTHQNPLILARASEVRGVNETTIGFEGLIDEMKKEIEDYFTGQQNKSDSDSGNNKPYIAFIQGEVGSGKTAFMRHLFAELKQLTTFESYVEQNKGKLPVFASMINAESRLLFLNAWRSVFQMLIKYFCKKRQMEKNRFIATFIIKEDVGELADLIAEVTGADLTLAKKNQRESFKSKVQIKPLENRNHFVQTPAYTAEDVTRICKFFTNLFKYIVGDSSEVESEWGEGSGSHDTLEKTRTKVKQRQQSSDSSDQGGGNNLEDPIMICIDNAHLMDATSWRLLGELAVEESQVAFFLIIKYDYRDRLLIVPEAKTAFDEAWQAMSDPASSNLQIHMYELPNLSELHVHDLILRNAIRYRETHITEVEDMTKIKDSTNTIKTEEMGNNWKKLLWEQWQLKRPFKSLEMEIVKVITRKCRGNPYLCLDYFKQMVHTAYVKIDNMGHVRPTALFYRCVRYNDWTPLITPQLAKKISAQILSGFLHQVSKKPGNQEEKAVSVVLLKTASVLGREFSVDALKYISTLPRDSAYNKRVDDAIMALEKADLLEIVDQSHGSGATCRWVQTLMHETLYQMVRYKPIKRDLHKSIEIFIQQHPHKMYKQPELDRSDQLLWHMLLAQDSPTEDGLTLERRNALTVMRIQKKVKTLPANRPIFIEQLLKAQSTGVHKIQSVDSQSFLSRLFCLSKDEISWYHDIEEYKSGSFIGRSKLSFIYDIMKVPTSGAKDQVELWAFQMMVSMHITRKKAEAGRRTIIIACETELKRDRWLAAIDFLKTKAIFDAYAKNNTLVNFMGDRNEEEKNEDQDELDMNELLYDFGGKLKGHTLSGIVSKKIAANQMRRGTAFTADWFGHKLKAPELVTRLRLLYQVGMTSFLHQLGTASMRDNQHVFTSDEEVERLPMQYPQHLQSETRIHIANIEGIEIDLPDARQSIMSGRRASFQSKLSRKKFAQSKCSSQSDQQNQVLAVKFPSRQHLSITQEPHIEHLLSVPGSIAKMKSSSDHTKGSYQTAQFPAQLSEFSKNSLIIPPVDDQLIKKETRRNSSFSADQPKAHNSSWHHQIGIPEVPDCEHSSTDSDTLQRKDEDSLLADVEVRQPTNPNKSDKIQQVSQLMPDKGRRSILNVQTIDSGGRVSEQLANLGERNLDHSSISQNPTQQQQYETSEPGAAQNRKVGRRLSRETDTKALIQLVKDQQSKIDSMLKNQNELEKKVSVHERILSPHKGGTVTVSPLTATAFALDSSSVSFEAAPQQQYFSSLQISQTPMRAKKRNLLSAYATLSDIQPMHQSEIIQHRKPADGSLSPPPQRDMSPIQTGPDEEKKANHYGEPPFRKQKTASFQEQQIPQLMQHTVERRTVMSYSKASDRGENPTGSEPITIGQVFARDSRSYLDRPASLAQHRNRTNTFASQTEDAAFLQGHVLELQSPGHIMGTIRTKGSKHCQVASNRLSDKHYIGRDQGKINEIYNETSPSPASGEHVLLLQNEDRQAQSECVYSDIGDDDCFSEASSNLLCPKSSFTVMKPKRQRHKRNQTSTSVLAMHSRGKAQSKIKQLLEK